MSAPAAFMHLLVYSVRHKGQKYQIGNGQARKSELVRACPKGDLDLGPAKHPKVSMKDVTYAPSFILRGDAFGIPSGIVNSTAVRGFRMFAELRKQRSCEAAKQFVCHFALKNTFGTLILDKL